MTEHLHSERLYRMPHSQWCYAPVYDVPMMKAPHAAEPGRVVFGSFNQFPKVSETCLDLWCEVLRRAPTAELRMLGVPQGKATTALLDAVARRGVDPARLAVQPRLGIAEYFEAIGDVDIALDTLPYNGATTTFDALWMGVPLVALRGDRSIARGSYSILATLGIPELLAATNVEFVERNLRLAAESGWRKELRQTLRTRMGASPLMDTVGFTRDLEHGYREMRRSAQRR
jgi:predicted O-linked N-acetylglucosamine transferase (SPINDLY family)